MLVRTHAEEIGLRIELDLERTLRGPGGGVAADFDRDAAVIHRVGELLGCRDAHGRRTVRALRYVVIPGGGVDEDRREAADEVVHVVVALDLQGDHAVVVILAEGDGVVLRGIGVDRLPGFHVLHDPLVRHAGGIIAGVEGVSHAFDFPVDAGEDAQLVGLDDAVRARRELHGLIPECGLGHAGRALIDLDDRGLVGVPGDILAHDHGGQREIALDPVRGLSLREAEGDEIHDGEVRAVI